VGWTIFNIVLIASPFFLLWGWIKYLQAQRSRWGWKASLIGLSAPLVSIGLWIVMLVMSRINDWHTLNPVPHALITVGVWIPVLGMSAGFGGRQQLIPAIVPGSIETILFWYGTTLP
jgi:hypothetical protein